MNRKAELLIVVFGRGLTILFGLIYIKILTNHSSVSDLGIYFFLVTVSYFGNALFFVPIDFFQQSKIYPFLKKNQSFKSFLFLNVKVLSLVFFFAVVLVLLSKTNLLIALLLSYLLYLSTFLKNLLNNLEFRVTVILFFLIEALLKIGMLLAVIEYSSRLAPELVLFSNAMVFVISVPLLILVSINKISKVSSARYESVEFSRNEVLSFCFPISLSAVFNWLQLQGYRLLLVPLGFEKSVGTYGVTSNIGHSGMSAANSIVHQMLTPKIYISNGNFIYKFVAVAMTSVLLVAIVSYAAKDWLIVLLTSKEYLPYSTLIVFGVAVEGANLIIGGLGIFLTIHNKTSLGVLPSMIGVAVSALSFLLLFEMNLLSSPYFIGIPLVLSQFVVILMLVVTINNLKKQV